MKIKRSEIVNCVIMSALTKLTFLFMIASILIDINKTFIKKSPTTERSAARGL
jgi:hypothetical protein